MNDVFKVWGIKVLNINKTQSNTFKIAWFAFLILFIGVWIIPLACEIDQILFLPQTISEFVIVKIFLPFLLLRRKITTAMVLK